MSVRSAEQNHYFYIKSMKKSSSLNIDYNRPPDGHAKGVDYYLNGEN